MNSGNLISLFEAAFSKMFEWGAFANASWFWALLAIPFIVLFYLVKDKKDNIDVAYSTTKHITTATILSQIRHLPFAIFCLSLVLFIFALARPQDAKSWEETKTEGIDMVIAMDISSSMNAPDFKPNRLEASKKIASEFISSRKNDRFGLVVFAAESFTQCPLTIDHARIIELFKDIRMGVLEDGTAIGDGLATSVQRLKDSEAKSKVIVLLTDGENNAGAISPKTAAELANTFDIKVYTIGIGKKVFTIQQKSLFGTYDQQVETKIDTEALNQIASITGGKYFRAESEDALKNIYEEIDLLEKTELASLKYYKKTELFLPFVLLGLLLLAVAKVLNITIFNVLD